MPEQTVKNIIDERNKDIKLSTIAIIASGFNMTLEEFFTLPIFKHEDIEF